jgi:hypothetical protein
MSKIRKKESVPVWKCPNGHWCRVELLVADGLFVPAICPICNALMELDRMDLVPVIDKFPIKLFNPRTRGWDDEF